MRGGTNTDVMTHCRILGLDEQYLTDLAQYQCQAARLRARPQPTPARPQFESVGLVPERFNRHYSRYRAREDRTRLRARVVERNSVSPVSVSPTFSFKFHVQHSQ